MKKRISWLGATFLGIAALVVICILIVAGYFITVFAKVYRIEDNLALKINKTGLYENVELGKNYTIVTNNIGFGAYDDAYDFFMDDGYADPEGLVKIHGTHARAISKDHVINNTNQAIETVKKLKPDFVFFQEVDTNSTRSYHINQEDLITEAFDDFSFTNACNYHSSYLCYPIKEPIGRSNSELLSLSTVTPTESVRRSLPLSTSRFANIVDLDRCIMINRYKIKDSPKELVLINVHMSAYDQGGLIRRKQVEFLREIFEKENAAQNYVIVGGDFNQVLIPEGPEYFIKKPNGEITPSWVATWEGSFPGYKIVATKEGDTNKPTGTARNNTKAYDPDWTYTCVIDGFITSDNITVSEIVNITSAEFKYSDHIPVKMQFTLN